MSKKTKPYSKKMQRHHDADTANLIEVTEKLANEMKSPIASLWEWGDMTVKELHQLQDAQCRLNHAIKRRGEEFVSDKFSKELPEEIRDNYTFANHYNRGEYPPPKKKKMAAHPKGVGGSPFSRHPRRKNAGLKEFRG